MQQNDALGLVGVTDGVHGGARTETFIEGKFTPEKRVHEYEAEG